jgi:hypothetical protein
MRVQCARLLWQLTTAALVVCVAFAQQDGLALADASPTLLKALALQR